MTESTPFASHAIVELMGHVRLAGHATEATIAGAGFVRVEIPNEDGTVKAVKLCSPQSIYAITPCDEETARAAANPPRFTFPTLSQLEARTAAGLDDADYDDEEGPF